MFGNNIGNNNIYNSLQTAKGLNVTELGKKTMSFATNSSTVTFFENGQFYMEDVKEGIPELVMHRNCYTIGSGYPWIMNHPQGKDLWFEGHIYSIRVYNRKLSEEELRNNYEVDRVRFNID